MVNKQEKNYQESKEPLSERVFKLYQKIESGEPYLIPGGNTLKELQDKRRNKSGVVDLIGAITLDSLLTVSYLAIASSIAGLGHFSYKAIEKILS